MKGSAGLGPEQCGDVWLVKLIVQMPRINIGGSVADPGILERGGGGFRVPEKAGP